MKAVVISGGQRTDRKRVMASMTDCDLLICADRGTDHALYYGLIPDYIIGDMDSIDPLSMESLGNSQIIVSPPEKDYTDTRLAVMKAIEAGCNEIDILCATGLRTDHSLANIRLLLYIDECGTKGRIINDESTIYLCTGRTVLKDKSGMTVSLISLACATKGITLRGFRYPLDGYDAGLDWTNGISNVVVSDKAVITIEEGCLLVFETEV